MYEGITQIYEHKKCNDKTKKMNYGDEVEAKDDDGDSNSKINKVIIRKIMQIQI